MARYRQVKPQPASGLAGMPPSDPAAVTAAAAAAAAAPPHTSGSLHPQTQSRLLATHEVGPGSGLGLGIQSSELSLDFTFELSLDFIH